MAPVGPAGPSGPAGANGPAGPAGANGLVQITRVMDMTSENNEGIKEASVQCPAGTVVLFGDGAITGPEGDTWIRTIPVSQMASETSWYARAEVWRTQLTQSDDCNCNDSWKLTVWAVCGPVSQVISTGE